MIRTYTLSALIVGIVTSQSAAAEPTTAARAKLIAADKAAASVAATDDINRIVEIWTDDAIVSFPGRPQAVGKQAIREMIIANRAQPGFEISWAPVDGRVADSKELGYTYGTFLVKLLGPGGESVKKTGNYLCIWKEIDGKWKCAHEMSQFHRREARENGR